MPPGTPTATVGLTGVSNAALLAARILAGAHPELRKALARRAERDRARYEPSAIRAEIEKRRQARRESDGG